MVGAIMQSRIGGMGARIAVDGKTAGELHILLMGILTLITHHIPLLRIDIPCRMMIGSIIRLVLTQATSLTIQHILLPTLRTLYPLLGLSQALVLL